MKKILITFCIFTLVIFVVSGFYHWLVKRDEVTTLSYIQDPEWSKWQRISSKVETMTGIYEGTVDTEGNFHLFWHEYDKKASVGVIMHKVVNSKGKVVLEPSRIIQNPRLFDVAVVYQAEKLHLFWIGKGDTPQLELFHSIYDTKGQKLAEKSITKGEFEEMETLKVAASRDGSFMAMWVNQGNGRQIYGLMIGADGSAKGSIFAITEPNYGAHKPYIVADQKGQFHLSWLKPGFTQKMMDEDVSSQSVIYQCFAQDGRAVTEAREIASAGSNPLAMAAGEEHVYVVWAKTLKIARKAETLDDMLPNYVLFGTAINIADPSTHTEIIRLSALEGPSFHQSLAVDAQGKVHLTYYGLSKALFLTHEVYDKDLQLATKSADIIYPAHKILYDTRQLRLKYGTLLLPDPKEGVHLVWLNTDSREGSHFYYANTVKPAWISPLAMIGLDQRHLVISAFMAFYYTFGISATNVLLSLVFAFAATGLLALCVWLLRNVKWLDNPYLLTVIICALHTWFINFLGIEKPFFWPVQPEAYQAWFVFATASVFTAIFVQLNKGHFRHVVFAGITAFFWIYWVNVLTVMYRLPELIIG